MKREKGKSLILGNYLVKPHFTDEETDPDSDMVCSSLQTKDSPIVPAGVRIKVSQLLASCLFQYPVLLEAAPTASLSCNHKRLDQCVGLSSYFRYEEFEKALHSDSPVEGATVDAFNRP